MILTAGTKYKRSVGRETPAFGSDLTNHNTPLKPAFDYEVLLLKRSGKSGFMPNAYVFPGGLVDPSDFSTEWLEVFKAFRHLPQFGIATVKQPRETRPPMFATDRKQLGSPIPGDVAFRICAVRETFEESGVLLVVPSEEEEADTLNAGGHGAEGGMSALTVLSHRWDNNLLAKWRSRVLENSSNFIRMCRELECVPNIWALYEWGNWLTPTRGSSVQQRRYDTAFYICCLEEIPFTLHDQKEIQHYEVMCVSVHFSTCSCPRCSHFLHTHTHTLHFSPCLRLVHMLLLFLSQCIKASQFILKTRKRSLEGRRFWVRSSWAIFGPLCAVCVLRMSDVGFLLALRFPPAVLPPFCGNSSYLRKVLELSSPWPVAPIRT